MLYIERKTLISLQPCDLNKDEDYRACQSWSIVPSSTIQLVLRRTAVWSLCDSLFICDIKMFLMIIFATISVVTSQELCPTCVKGNSTCYNITHLFDIDAPFRNRIVIHKLALLRATNTLYYSFEPNINDKEYYKVGFINIDDPKNNTVISAGKQIMNFGTFDLDQDNGLVYLGGSDGIYVLDTKVNKVAPYSSRGDTVLSLFFKGNVYFVRYGEFRVVKKKGDNFDVIVEHMPVKKFVVNNNFVTVFLSTYGLYASKNDEVVCLSYNPYFRGLTIDKVGTVFVWWLDGIYKVVIEKKLAESKLVKVVYIDDVGALTFDRDNNFLFTSGKSVFKLIDRNATCDGREKKKKIRL